MPRSWPRSREPGGDGQDAGGRARSTDRMPAVRPLSPGLPLEDNLWKSLPSARGPCRWPVEWSPGRAGDRGEGRHHRPPVEHADVEGERPIDGHDVPGRPRPRPAQDHAHSVQMGAATMRSSSGYTRGPVWRTTPAVKRSPRPSRSQHRCFASSRSGAAPALTSIPTIWRAASSPSRSTSCRPCSWRRW